MDIPSACQHKINNNLKSRLQLAAFDAWDYFGREKGKFGQYLGYISKIGISEAYSRLSDQRQQGIKEIKYFFKKIK